MTLKPKYRITVYHPAWYAPWADRQVSLEMFDKRSNKYKAVKTADVGVRDARRK